MSLGELAEATGIADEDQDLLEQMLADGGVGEVASSAIPRRDPSARLVLSFAQLRLWFLDQLEPATAFYNVVQAMRLDGALAHRRLRGCLDAVVGRHEALRTTFSETTGLPEQIVSPGGAVELPVVDLSALPFGAREPEMLRVAVAESRRPFDLARGPLVRALLLRLAAEAHVLVATMHHIISDGWSLGVLMGDFALLYSATASGEAAARLPLPELPIQYADYALWQRRWLAGETLEGQLEYWRRELAGVSGLELPTDRPRPAVESFRGRNRSFAFPARLSDGLRDLSRRHGVTLFMTLLAGFQTLLYRVTGQTDLPVGSPIANRNRREVEGLIGFFSNTLVLRGRLRERQSFAALLAEVRATTLSAYAHQELPFEKLVEELSPERDMSRNPLFQVMLVVQNQPWPAFELGELRLSGFTLDSGTAKFDLTLFFRESASGELPGLLEHNSDLFDPTTAERLLRGYERLLAAAVERPEARLSELALLSASERHQVVAEWNATGVAEGLACVHEWVERQVDRTPEAVAAVWEGEALSYGELEARANRLARGLRRLGVGPESLVGICVERSLRMVVAMLGVLKAGGAGVALDPAYPKERLAFIVKDAGLTVLLTEHGLEASFPELAELGLERTYLDGAEEPFAGESAERLASGAGLEHPIYAIYTSGSTGQPKGIVVTHRAFANLVSWQLRHSALQERARTVQFATFGFCVSFQEIFTAWCSGGTLVVAGEALRRDIERLGEMLEAEGIERLHLPFAALKHLAESAESAESSGSSESSSSPSIERPRPPGRLREVITAGEQLVLTPSVRRLFERLPGCSLHNQYGASETHVVTALSLAGEPASWPSLPAVGRPIANVGIHLLDGELEPVPVGVRGELYAGGACVARGYLGDAWQTAWKLVPDGLSGEAGARLYRTGDVARYLADGKIEYFGRADGQVKVRGFRVEPGEIETLLSRQAGVRDVAVVAQAAKAGGPRLVAYLVAEPGVGGEEWLGALRLELKRRLPDYMVPSALMVLPVLPLNANGKLDREALPAAGGGAGTPRAAYVAPRTPVEEVVAGIWQEVLGVERVGVEESFFDVGGHSLLATQVISRVRSAFQVELPLRRLFETPTVAGLACAVVAAEARPGQSEKVARVVRRIQQMSEAEKQAVLGRSVGER